MSILRRRLLPAVLATALAASAAAQSGESPKGEARGGAAADAGGGIKPEPAGDLIWGANGHPLMSYPGTTYEQQLDYLKALGMTSYRVDISSLDQADRLARLVRLAKARGIEILPVITPALGPRQARCRRAVRKGARLGDEPRRPLQGRHPRVGARQ